MQSNQKNGLRSRLYPKKMGTEFPSSGEGFNQILNPFFLQGAANWTMGTGWSPSGFTAVHAAGTASDLTSLSAGAEVGATYEVFYHLNWTAGTFLITWGGVVSPARVANGDFLTTVTAITNGTFNVNGDASANGSIQEIRVRKIFFQ